MVPAPVVGISVQWWPDLHEHGVSYWSSAARDDADPGELLLELRDVAICFAGIIFNDEANGLLVDHHLMANSFDALVLAEIAEVDVRWIAHIPSCSTKLSLNACSGDIPSSKHSRQKSELTSTVISASLIAKEHSNFIHSANPSRLFCLIILFTKSTSNCQTRPSCRAETQQRIRWPAQCKARVVRCAESEHPYS